MAESLIEKNKLQTKKKTPTSNKAIKMVSVNLKVKCHA